MILSPPLTCPYIFLDAEILLVDTKTHHKPLFGCMHHAELKSSEEYHQLSIKPLIIKSVILRYDCDNLILQPKWCFAFCFFTSTSKNSFRGHITMFIFKFAFMNCRPHQVYLSYLSKSEHVTSPQQCFHPLFFFNLLSYLSYTLYWYQNSIAIPHIVLSSTKWGNMQNSFTILRLQA